MVERTPLVFLDTETTGLDPYRDDIWDIAWITVDDQGRNEHQLYVQHDANKAVQLPAEFRADWARRYDATTAVPPFQMVKMLLDTIAGKAHLIGACPWFDQEFLRITFDAAGDTFPWHYHLVDVEALAVGALAKQAEPFSDQHAYPPLQPPWESDQLSRAIGVDPDEFDRHTALGDARWAEAMYNTIMSSP